MGNRRCNNLGKEEGIKLGMKRVREEKKESANKEENIDEENEGKEVNLEESMEVRRNGRKEVAGKTKV